MTRAAKNAALNRRAYIFSNIITPVLGERDQEICETEFASLLGQTVRNSREWLHRYLSRD